MFDCNPSLQKSEPIKTILLTLTGQKNVNVAIEVYFDIMSDAFNLTKRSMLRLRKDFFNKKIIYKELRPNHIQTKIESPTGSVLEEPSTAVDQIPEQTLDQELPKLEKIFEIEATVIGVRENEALVEFSLNKQLTQGILARDNFRCRSVIENGCKVLCNAVWNSDLNTWVCLDAWIPGLKLYGIKAVLKNYDSEKGGVTSFIAPNQHEYEAVIHPMDFYTPVDEPIDANELYIDVVHHENNNGYIATLAWFGQRPSETEIKIRALEVEITKDLNDTR